MKKQKKITSKEKLTKVSAKEVIKNLIFVVEKYRTGLDQIYNHNEAARAAVILNFGRTHPITNSTLNYLKKTYQ